MKVDVRWATAAALLAAWGGWLGHGVWRSEMTNSGREGFLGAVVGGFGVGLEDGGLLGFTGGQPREIFRWWGDGTGVVVGRDEYGWDASHTDEQSFIDTQECTIDRVEDLTRLQFMRDYRGRRPVIFPAANNDEFRQLTSRESLIRAFGNSTITLSSANSISHGKQYATLAQYISNNMVPQKLGVRADDTFYHFGDNVYSEWDSLLNQYNRPPIHEDSYQMGTLSFGLGGSGSGVNFHTHGPAYAEVLHGRKRWFLYEPKHSPKPVVADHLTSQQWVHDSYPKLQEGNIPLECVCGVGEVIYIPHEWYHATLNIGESIFISTFV